MTKTTQLQIRVSAHEKALIKDRAQQAGEDVSKWALKQLLPPIQETIAHLTGELARGSPDRSYVFAELHDLLATLSERTLEQAVAVPPPQDLDPFAANYLAAMIEHQCVLKAVAVPVWLRRIEPLPEPWFATSLMSLRLHLLTRSPAAFRRRNLFVDSTIGDRV